MVEGGEGEGEGKYDSSNLASRNVGVVHIR